MADEIEPIADLTPDEEAILDGHHLAHGHVGAVFHGRVKERIGIVRRKLVAGLVSQGWSREDAIGTVGAFGDGHIFELIIKYGPDIMKMVLAIIALF